MALMGYQPLFHDVQPYGTTMPTIEEQIQYLHQIRDEINASSRIASELMTRRNGTLPSYKEGDEVWLEAKNITTTHPMAKLAPKRYGPFTIEKMLGPVTAKLRLPPQWKIHPVFHISLLTPYQITEENGEAFDRPPPDLVDEEEEYEVEAIRDSRKFRGKIQFLVKWKGYPEAENTWEPPKHITHADEELLAFYNQNPTKPGYETYKPKNVSAAKIRNVNTPCHLHRLACILCLHRRRTLLPRHLQIPRKGITRRPTPPIPLPPPEPQKSH